MSHRVTDTDAVNQITERVIGCGVEVHRNLGPALLEAVYEEALCIEFQDAGIAYRRRLPIPVRYKSRTLGEYRLDLFVEDAVIVEVKSVERFDPVFERQIPTYLRVTQKRVGLLINFTSRLLREGIERFVL